MSALLLLDVEPLAPTKPSARARKTYAKSPRLGAMLEDGRHRAQVWASGVRNGTKWCVDENQQVSLWGAERGTGVWRFLNWFADLEPHSDLDRGAFH